MGVIVLAEDVSNAACPAGLGGGSMGWGRLFIVVRDSSGTVRYSHLSRAGAANPPPGASTSSGGTPERYPFAIIRDNGRWRFLFDWINKGQYQNSQAGTFFEQVFFLAEATGGAELDDRSSAPTFRVWPGGANTQGGWWQPAATAFYNLSSGASCDDADLTLLSELYSLEGGSYRRIQAGDLNSGACNYTDGAPLW